jgi:hypothetical protein
MINSYGIDSDSGGIDSDSGGFDSFLESAVPGRSLLVGQESAVEHQGDGPTHEGLTTALNGLQTCSKCFQGSSLSVDWHKGLKVLCWIVLLFSP